MHRFEIKPWILQTGQYEDLEYP